MEKHYPFSLPPLPYDYAALMPQLDPRTMMLHHDRHFAAYVDGLNRLLEQAPDCQKLTLPRLCMGCYAAPWELRSRIEQMAGGVYQHDLYFKLMTPKSASAPSGLLQQAVRRCFGDLGELKKQMRQAVLSVNGSGWVWLTLNCHGDLLVVKTANQNTTFPLLPLVGVDVWEHAYYLKYQNERGKYFENWWQLIDWPRVSQRYECLLGDQWPIPMP